MSQITEEGPLREAAILTRAVENVFRKLIRLLVGRMSLTKLQEMIRTIYVEEAEAKLELEESGENISLSRLGILTGLDTRTLKKVRKKISESAEFAQDELFLDSLTPLFRVFDLWMNDERFFDSNKKRPRVLKVDEGENSFTDLIRIAISARGITVNSILQRLKKSGIIIENTRENLVEITNKDNIFISKDELDMIEMGLEATSRLLGTISHNIKHRLNKSEKFFQRGLWNYQMNPAKLKETRNAMHDFLVDADKKGRELISSLAEPESCAGQVTSGIGLFYFEVDSNKSFELKAT